MLALACMLPTTSAISGDRVPPELLEAISTAYGKAVPKQAVCLSTVILREVEADVLAVGITQRLAGCRLKGLWTDGEWSSIEDGIPNILGDLARDRNATTLYEDWTREVLLAFDQGIFTEPLQATHHGSGWQVTGGFYQREDGVGQSRHSQGTWTFDSAGRLTAVERDNGQRYTTRLLSTAYRTEGIAEDAVRAAIHTRGGHFKQCFQQAWEVDLSLEGPVRLHWTMAGGIIKTMGVVDAKDTQRGLLTCYSSWLRKVPFPESFSGSVRWSFTADRRKID